MINNEYDKIIKIIDDTFSYSLKVSTLDFFSYLYSNSMKAERILGYWKNQFYWVIKYKNEIICYILINGTGNESQFAPITIWSDDSGSNWYENLLLDEEIKNIVWKNIDYCVHCGSCLGGTKKILLGKEFNNVCRTAIRFTNPDNYEFGVIKELIKARMQDIEVNYD